MATEEYLNKSKRYPQVYIGIPSYGCIDMGLLHSVGWAFQRGNVLVNSCQGSLLQDVFNRLYCEALFYRKNGCRYFLMLHADISPQQKDWIDILIREMEKHDLGAISAISPIKMYKGYTSTAIDMANTKKKNIYPWPFRRLTLREIGKLPDSFDGKIAANYIDWIPKKDPILLINTGVLMIDMFQDFAEQIHFEINSTIVKLPNGKYMPVVEPEDWNLSRQLHKLGVKYMATKKVTLFHTGQYRYDSADYNYGLETDIDWPAPDKPGNT